MTDEQLLLAAVLASPDDDTPRLAFADWLGENGQGERAEFIRVQCELARVDMKMWQDADPKSDMCWGCWIKATGAEYRHKDAVKRFGCKCSGRVTFLCRRERELLEEAHTLEWFPLSPYVKWSRGFVESVTCSGRDWEAHGDAICATHPVRAVTFTEGAPAVEHDHGPSEKDGERVFLYLVAGKWVSVRDKDMRDGRPAASGYIPDEIRAVADYNCRLILSARWPSIPPAGWTFAAAPVHL